MMIEPALPGDDTATEETRIEAIVAAGPKGAFALAGAAVALVLAMWWAFYLFVYIARQA